MNIIIHTEVAARELDSNILLAAVAASRGHEVLVSNVQSINVGLDCNCFYPGVFHTKSLTPSQKKIFRHKKIKEAGFIVTSQDQEAGLIESDYTRFAKSRYSDATIGSASAVFCWGNSDFEKLNELYTKNKNVFFKVGSPRVDLWRAELSEYWPEPSLSPSRPFLLVASNLASNAVRRLEDFVSFYKRAGYLERDPQLFKWRFLSYAEQVRLTYEYINALEVLTKKKNDFDIVFRPHPAERVEAWEVFLSHLPSVHVIREGSITAWVKRSFAVMHNGCTTALEATISGKPVVTYLPFKREYARDLPNKLGVRVHSPEALSVAVNRLFDASHSGDGNDKEEALPESVAEKIHIDDAELAAEKIVKVWESLDNGELSRPCNWTKFQAHLKLAKLRRMVGMTLRKAFPGKFEPAKEDYKFPPMDAADISERVKRLQRVLGIHRELECKLLSDRAVLIRPGKVSTPQ